MRGTFFFLGLVAGICFTIACGGKIGVFPYKYYALGLSPECYDKGVLIGKAGHDGWPDLPLLTCKPDEKGNQLKCVIVTDGDFYDAKAEFLKCEQDLGNCQKKCR